MVLMGVVMMAMLVVSIMMMMMMMMVFVGKGCNDHENGPNPGPKKANQEDGDEDELKQADDEHSDIAGEESEQGCCESGKKELTNGQENGSGS
jgi:hypothetical protein